MKKILYIHHAGSLGGAPRSLSFLIEKLDKKKYKPYVLMIEDGPARKLFESVGAEVIVDTRLGAFHGTTVSGVNMKVLVSNIVYLIPSIIYGKKIIKKINPDIIHLNTTCLFLYAKIAKDLNEKIPVVTHVREPLLDSMIGKILKYMNYKYTDAYIAIEKYDLSKLNTKGKIHKVIYNFVDFSNYNTKIKSNVLRNELGINEEDIIFLYLARISQENGVLEMLKNINTNKLDKRFNFVIVGESDNFENEYENNVRNECRKNNKIHLLKFRNDIPDVIASSDVIVSPFTEPHFSRAVIESAAMGKPALVSNVKGLEELVKDKVTGYIYDKNDKDDFISKLNILGSKKEIRIEFGKNAEKRAKQLFDSNVNTIKIIEIYEELLKI